MNLFDAIQKRFSCRAYLDKPIPKDVLNKILEAARQAPSAKNFQDWRFIVVDDKELKQKLSIAAKDQTFIADAGVIIVACSNSDYVMSCGLPIAPIDVAIALEHIALAATAQGLATCWIGAFYPEQVRKILNIPQNVQIIELMPVGYPAQRERHLKRLSLEDITSHNKWDFQE